MAEEFVNLGTNQRQISLAIQRKVEETSQISNLESVDITGFFEFRNRLISNSKGGIFMPHLFEELLDDIAIRVARNRNVIDEDIITMDNVVSYLVKQKNMNPEVKKTAVSVTEEKDVDRFTKSRKLIFIQMLLDADGKPLKQGEKSYQGRTLYINGMDSELQQWLGGQNSKILEF